MDSDLEVSWLGTVPYAEALGLQREAVEARRRGVTGDRLLLLEHPPVVTLGRRADETNLLRSPEDFRRLGIEVHRIARGGDVTYHAPGQLVGYPIVDLERRGRPDVHAFLRLIELSLIDALSTLGVPADVRSGATGVFVAGSRPPRKIASIGIGVRRWITYHGFALNLDIELSGFGCIVPCGLRDVEMTSVARERGQSTPVDLSDRAQHAVARAFVRHLARLAAGESGAYTARACRVG